MPYRVELQAPEGPSTAGGKQTLQHVKLVPVGGGPTIVAGAANPVEKTAELRSYDYLADAYAQRFRGAEIPVDRDLYADLLHRMETFFKINDLRIARLEVGVTEHKTAKSSLSVSIAVMVLVAGLTMAVAGLALLAFR